MALKAMDNQNPPKGPNAFNEVSEKGGQPWMMMIFKLIKKTLRT